MTLSAGDRIAHYRIVERIGAGGMGEVYKALDLRLGRNAALKLLPQHLTSDEERVRRFVREAKSASALTHPNIVTIYDTDRADVGGTPTWYIAMELVEGETLRARLQRGELDLASAATLVAQIADALAKAHALGIVHRDLKPENIMITGDGFAKVLDFGLAKLIEAKRDVADSAVTADGVIVGTICYMSPEQIRGDEVDARSDVFALGCILYELVSRRRPYAAPTALESLHRTMYDDPQRLAGASPELAAMQRIIDRCLRKHPADRYASAKELASDLRRFARLIERASEPAPLSIAVLPFRDLTSAHDNAHIALGLADAIITELAASRRLVVRPTAAIVSYRDRNVDASAAGRELGVDAVVDGAFQRAGSRLRVTVQLVSTEGARSLWATKIDSSLDDLFAIQDEVARRIAESLSIDIAPQARAAQQPAASANESYMKGKLALCYETIDKTKEAIDAFLHATASDPSFAPAWAGLADAYVRLAFNWDPSGDWYRKGVDAAERALSIDSDLPEAHYVRGRMKWSPAEHFDHVAAIREYAAAVRMNPNLGEAHGRLGLVLWHVGIVAEAEDELRQAVAINPMDRVSDSHFASCRLILGEWSVCLDLANERIERAPTAWLCYTKALALLRLDRDAEAVECTDLAALRFPESAFYFPLRALLAAKAGDRTRAFEHVARTIEHEKMYGHYHHAQYDVGCVHALLGDADEALRWLRDAAQNGFPNATMIENDVLLASIRGDALDALIAETRRETDQYRELYASLIRSATDEAATLRL
ncbi:MAG TPA: protein kinase [Thermoanaerobaculia bacterium]|nr:protein kinase [Thermoanaerobaculia bacterium]